MPGCGIRDPVTISSVISDPRDEPAVLSDTVQNERLRRFTLRTTPVALNATPRPGELISIGTLLAFAIVCAAIPILRRRTNQSVGAGEPGRIVFRTPFVPLIPLLGVASCVILMLSLPVGAWIRLVVWLSIGLIVYAAFG